MAACPAETLLFIAGSRVDGFRACQKPSHVATFPKLCDWERRWQLAHELHADRQCGSRALARVECDGHPLQKQNRVMTAVFNLCRFVVFTKLHVVFTGSMFAALTNPQSAKRLETSLGLADMSTATEHILRHTPCTVIGGTREFGHQKVRPSQSVLTE